MSLSKSAPASLTCVEYFLDKKAGEAYKSSMSPGSVWRKMMSVHSSSSNAALQGCPGSPSEKAWGHGPDMSTQIWKDVRHFTTVFW